MEKIRGRSQREVRYKGECPFCTWTSANKTFIARFEDHLTRLHTEERGWMAMDCIQQHIATVLYDEDILTGVEPAPNYPRRSAALFRGIRTSLLGGPSRVRKFVHYFLDLAKPGVIANSTVAAGKGGLRITRQFVVSRHFANQLYRQMCLDDGLLRTAAQSMIDLIRSRGSDLAGLCPRADKETWHAMAHYIISTNVARERLQRLKATAHAHGEWVSIGMDATTKLVNKTLGQGTALSKAW